ncbi:MAG: hypothetical protein M1817_005813 [Caeruleum heppii]|nr:MAG: hypothetical protein M1817_005813 [Caeruleum heppii]
MSAAVPLQLFPPPPSKVKGPKRKPSRKKVTKVNGARAKSPSHTKEIVIHVSEKRPTSPGSSTKANDFRTNPRSPRSELPSRSQAASPAQTNVHSVRSGSLTLVRSDSNASAAQPMQSIFPQYNRSVPLAHQNYRPTQASPTHIPRDAISKQPYSPSMYSPMHAHSNHRSSDRCLPSPAFSPFAISSFPPTSSGQPLLQYSTQEELEQLWEAANGQVSAEDGREFALTMTREGTVDQQTRAFTPTANESYTFGSSSTQPFFDLQTLKSNDLDASFSECNIRRHDPCKGAVIPVMTMMLEPPSRRAPPEDGLITQLYPKLAAMMALDQVHSTQGLPISGTDPETEAQKVVERAAQRECCRLYWDADSSRYYLLHPGLEKRFIIETDGVAGFDVPGARGIIKLTESKTEEILAGLDVGTATLSVNTAATAKIPSLYMVDLAVSAVLVVALVEGRRLRADGQIPPAVRSEKMPPATPKADAVGAVPEVPRVAAQETGELPKPAEGALSFLTVAFQFLVWLLSVVFGGLAAAVVTVTACFARKKDRPLDG